MFTGIIQSQGRIVALDRAGDWTITVQTALPLSDVALGASMACNGVCLTIIARAEDRFTVQVSPETQAVTTARTWQVGTVLNLERALRLGDELGGHLVLGHVDGIATLVASAQRDDSVTLTFDVPPALARFLAPKGSVTLDGVSLTINEVDGARFTVNIIPHTQSVTTLGTVSAGTQLNLEVDMMARYIDRLLTKQAQA